MLKSAFRKSRSEDRIRALRKFSTTKIQKEQKKSSSEEGNSDDQDQDQNSLEENSNTNVTNSPKRKSPKKSGGKHKIFNSIGYELGLVDTIEKDILQKNPKICWSDIAGLQEAKAILQEAVVLPIIMPDFFRGIRRYFLFSLIIISLLIFESFRSSFQRPWRGILLGNLKLKLKRSNRNFKNEILNS